jgi:hypothetical protein
MGRIVVVNLATRKIQILLHLFGCYDRILLSGRGES